MNDVILRNNSSFASIIIKTYDFFRYLQIGEYIFFIFLALSYAVSQKDISLPWLLNTTTIQ